MPASTTGTCQNGAGRHQSLRSKVIEVRRSNKHKAIAAFLRCDSAMGWNESDCDSDPFCCACSSLKLRSTPDYQN